MTHEIRITIRISPQLMRALLILAMLVADPLETGSESLTLSTTYPSPAGVYAQVQVTNPAQNTLLQVINPRNPGLNNTQPTVLIAQTSTANGSPRLGLIDTRVAPRTVAGSPVWLIDNLNDQFRIFHQPTIDTAPLAPYLTILNAGPNTGIFLQGGSINPPNQVYRCVNAGALPVGALTINPANCGASPQALPLFVP